MNPTDQAKFNPVQQPLLNEKVLRDKRKKLRETFERIIHLYERENPETYKELRKLELDYETKRGQLALYFDSVKNAESVEVDSIPLPDMPHAPSNIHIQDIPLPGVQPPSILKKTPFGLVLPGVPRLPPGKKPPGPPPGPPPPQVLALYGIPSRRAYSTKSDRDDRDDDSDSEEDSEEEREGGDNDRNKDADHVRFADLPAEGDGKKKKKRVVKKSKAITPLQAMMLRMAGEDECHTHISTALQLPFILNIFKYLYLFAAFLFSGQSIPEEDEDEEEEEEYTDGSDSSDTEDRGSMGEKQPHSLASQNLPPTAGNVAQQGPPPMQGPPMTGPPPLGPPPAPPMRPPGPPSGPPPGPPPGLFSSQPTFASFWPDIKTETVFFRRSSLPEASWDARGNERSDASSFASRSSTRSASWSSTGPPSWSSSRPSSSWTSSKTPPSCTSRFVHVEKREENVSKTKKKN
uniref:WW domain binding protein 11 n=1 Tax=Oryzias sinensis TaxID=183150 RepID=A0A8C7Z240_9TELE